MIKAVYPTNFISKHNQNLTSHHIAKGLPDKIEQNIPRYKRGDLKYMTNYNNNNNKQPNNKSNSNINKKFEDFTAAYSPSRAGSNGYRPNQLHPDSVRSFENSNGSNNSNGRSHYVLPPISSLMNPGPQSGRSSFDSNGRHSNELETTGMESQSVSARISTSPIQTKSMTKVNSFPSINTLNPQYQPNNFIRGDSTEKPAFLYQPQSQVQIQSQAQTQPQVSYVQYLSPSIPKTIIPTSIPNSNFTPQNIAAPHPPQQSLIPTFQYAVPVQQPQMTMVNNNGVLTTMTPINLISSVGPQPPVLSQVQQLSPQQFIVPPPPPQHQGQNVNMIGGPPHVINYVLTPMVNNNNIDNNTIFNLQHKRSNTTTIKPSPPSTIASTPSYIPDSSRSFSLPIETNSSTVTVKDNIKKAFGTTNAIDCSTKIKHKRSSRSISKKSSKHISQKSKDLRDSLSSTQFINHDNKTIKFDEKNKNYTVDFSSAVKHRKQCSICGKICSRPSTLKTHYLIHTGDTPFKCTFEGCNKAFNVKSNMLRHMKCHQRHR